MRQCSARVRMRSSIVDKWCRVPLTSLSAKGRIPVIVPASCVKDAFSSSRMRFKAWLACERSSPNCDRSSDVGLGVTEMSRDSISWTSVSNSARALSVAAARGSVDAVRSFTRSETSSTKALRIPSIETTNPRVHSDLFRALSSGSAFLSQLRKPSEMPESLSSSSRNPRSSEPAPF